MERLKGKVAIVTGSAQGMGYAIAQAMAREAAKVVITDIMEEAIRKTVEALKKEQVEVVGKVMDVTNKSQVRDKVQEIVERYGGIDILVNNAGGALHTPHLLEEIEEQDWDLVVNVNLKGAFLCCQQVIPGMVEKGGGSIVNISALAGHWRASLDGVQ